MRASPRLMRTSFKASLYEEAAAAAAAAAASYLLHDLPQLHCFLHATASLSSCPLFVAPSSSDDRGLTPAHFKQPLNRENNYSLDGFVCLESSRARIQHLHHQTIFLAQWIKCSHKKHKNQGSNSQTSRDNVVLAPRHAVPHTGHYGESSGRCNPPKEL